MPIEKLRKLLFGSGSSLSRLSAEAKNHQALLHQLQAVLPESIAHHCIAASIDGDTVILVTDSAAWAAQLRFSEPSILAVLSTSNVTQVSIRVGTRPENLSPATKPEPVTKISEKGRQSIESCADSVTDKSLSDALRRLATRASKKTRHPE